jgi:hypothetical protein
MPSSLARRAIFAHREQQSARTAQWRRSSTIGRSGRAGEVFHESPRFSLVQRMQCPWSMCRKMIALLSCTLGLSGIAHAESVVETPAKRPVGAIAAVESVVFEPNEKEATRVRILGAFRLYRSETGDYGEAQVGYMYFDCPAGNEAECRTHWHAFADAARAQHCVGFGWDTPPGTVRAADEAKSTPDAYLLLNGMHVLQEEDDDRCVDALGARRTAYKPLSKPVAIAPDEAPEPPKPARREWYGGQTILADSLSVSTFVVGSGTSSAALVSTGFLGYMLATPIVHWSHGHVGRGFASLGMRLGAVVGIGYGAMLYFQSMPSEAGSGSSGSSSGSSSGTIGLLLGLGGVVALLAAPAIDATTAYDEAPKTMGLRAAPWISKGGGGLAVGGSF